ncbi:MAG TPA: DUF2480 family protein [Flavobacteriales bacterium]|jgi:hypothetical protein|nr:DUF2480 family protein [Flavobacteriales bacterium]
MAEEIENKVAQSALVNFNLEDHYTDGERSVIDISKYLDEGIVLREKLFRDQLINEDWSIYQGHYIALTCSTDAIIPTWAYMLISSHLEGVARKVVFGELETLETVLFEEALHDIDLEKYRDKPVIVNGCGDKPVPEAAYVKLTSILKPVVKSLMFGEACSTVPIFKRK